MTYKRVAKTDKKAVIWICEQICGALRDLVPFAQFKKREKHPWRSVNFRCFSRFLNCTNGTKLRNASHLIT